MPSGEEGGLELDSASLSFHPRGKHLSSEDAKLHKEFAESTQAKQALKGYFVVVIVSLHRREERKVVPEPETGLSIDLTSTYYVCTRRAFGAIGHRTQALQSGVLGRGRTRSLGRAGPASNQQSRHNCIVLIDSLIPVFANNTNVRIYHPHLATVVRTNRYLAMNGACMGGSGKMRVNEEEG
ncbi:hypothetical protein TNCV_3493421 [Trichonephila clavipes]|nr:hypothetical protein TNCV_3493421 [Trichonephila clavipes]